MTGVPLGKHKFRKTDTYFLINPEKDVRNFHEKRIIHVHFSAFCNKASLCANSGKTYILLY